MKRLLLLLFSLPLFAGAQDKSLIAEGASPALYVTHTVAPKENYYSIGRMYNISPKEIAPFNSMQLEKGLSLGQVLKVPLTTGNFVQSGNPATDEAFVPVYHIVQDKEGLFRISTNHNKLPLATLKQWNNITGESVSNGTKLIVGYLKVKKDLSPLAAMAGNMPVETKVVPVEKPKPVVEKPVEKPKPVVEKPVEKAKPVEEKQVAVEPAKKDPPKEVKPVEQPKEEPANVAIKSFGGGVFKTDFDKQSRNAEVSKETGVAAIFKSTSGWEDGKYYCLHNSAAPGTIIKITNNVTGKSAFVKVLDVIPDIKQNNGLLIRISNAAAEEIGAQDVRFDCTLSYYK